MGAVLVGINRFFFWKELVIEDSFPILLGFPGGAVIKNLPAMQETQVHPLGREDPLEKGMVTHSSIIGQRITWTEKPGRATVHEVTKSQTRLNQQNT